MTLLPSRVIDGGWRLCPACDVRWHSEEPLCWNCGTEGKRTHTATPHMTSGMVVRAMSDDEWKRVRSEIGTE